MNPTLYEIMADNMIIYAKKTKNGQINTTVINEDIDQVVFCETGDPAAWDALVYFANQIISENKQMDTVQ